MGNSVSTTGIGLQNHAGSSSVMLSVPTTKKFRRWVQTARVRMSALTLRQAIKLAVAALAVIVLSNAYFDHIEPLFQRRTLRFGEHLRGHEWLHSAHGRYHLRVHPDCNVCIHKRHKRYWCSDVTLSPTTCVAKLRSSGELCVYVEKGMREVWCSNYGLTPRLDEPFNLVGYLDESQDGHLVVAWERSANGFEPSTEPWLERNAEAWSTATHRSVESSLKDLARSYGRDCHKSSNIDVLIPIPVKPWMRNSLRYTLHKQLAAMECNNHGFNLHLHISDELPPDGFQDVTGRERISSIRNYLIRKYLSNHHDYVLWFDADIVSSPHDLVTRLYHSNPGGVTAPLVLIEATNTAANHFQQCHRDSCNAGPPALQFYDVAAFFEEGRVVRMPNRTRHAHDGFGTVNAFPPYFATPGPKIKCESVGTIYLIPAEIYRCTDCRRLGIEHFATALTEHFPVVHAAKYLLQMEVITDTSVVALHANLPLYGEPWHAGDPPDAWNGWIAPYLGLELSDPSLGFTGPDSHSMPRPILTTPAVMKSNQIWSKLKALGLPVTGSLRQRRERLERALNLTDHQSKRVSHT